MTRAGVAALAAGAAALAASAHARADVPGMFGPSPRSAAVARADVAEPLPTDAPRQNAALAAETGTRLFVGYGYAGLHLEIDGSAAPVDDVGGVTIAAQVGRKVASWIDVGGAFSLHLPDRYLAKITFRPATEPQFPLYETPLDRASFDLVAAARLGGFSIGGGLATSIDLGGGGTSFDLGQDAHGTHADAAVDVALPYRFAPIVGIAWRFNGTAGTGSASSARPFDGVAIGASFRGPLSTEVGLLNQDTIDVSGNPLNGTTTVVALGTEGYDPARVDLGGSVAIGRGLTAMFAFEYAVWGDAPRPVADVVVALDVGTNPSMRKIIFPNVQLRDTLSPRLGLELRRPIGAEGSERWWAVRAGYAFSPSPVPDQHGFTSYADADWHEASFGAGVRLGRALGVAWGLDAAGQIHVLEARSFDKPDAALPHPHYDVSGRLAYGAIGLEAVLP